MGATRPVPKLPIKIENVKDEEVKQALRAIEQQYRLIVMTLEEFESRIKALEP